MPIKILAEEVASQIAAGEVVERPASVVKELIENALDAGATKIEVTIEGAGTTLIEVADDGHGIPIDEISVALARHATSKLSTAEDLFRIETLGFRGEALASIASVSQFVLTSRNKHSEFGGKINVEGGEIVGEISRVGVPIGTVVQVSQLFYNVPARLKFLKTPTTERRQIDQLVSRFALAYPNVRFQLIQEGKKSLFTSGNGKRREVLSEVYSTDVAKQMLAVDFQENGIEVSGYISPTGLSRSNRRGILFFVNGRSIQDITLTTALIQAYRGMLMVGRYPIASIFLKIPPGLVDVNVHPAKSEVRFADRQVVFSQVQRAVRRGLMAYTVVPEHQSDAKWAIQQRFTPQVDDPRNDTQPLATDRNPFEVNHASRFNNQENYQPELPETKVPLLRPVGQIGSSYLVAEGPDGLYLVDQHAAHERILFEKFMSQREKKIPSQQLLTPTQVTLTSESSKLLENQLPLMKTLGFEIEPFGPNTFTVRAMPSLLLGSDPAAALRVVIEDFEEDETPLENEIEAKIIARVCKRAAVKAGQILSPAEQRALIMDLEACKAPRTCPHGRPTMIHLSIDVLERQFGRRGAR
jgi:DNA mismatch repair protein MutL